MGVDITHIVKHNFRFVEDREASIAFARATIEKLRNRLCFVETEDDFDLTYDEETNETQFRLPICEIETTRRVQATWFGTDSNRLSEV